MFEYAVKYWDEIDGKVERYSGILGADSYEAAVKKVVEYCSVPDKLGENIIAVSVSELENPLDWEEIKEMLDNKEERVKL